MAGQEFSITAHQVADLQKEVQTSAQALRDVVVATLTASIISRMTGPVSIGYVLELQTDLRYALYPALNADEGPYETWYAAKEKKLSKIHHLAGW
jgi:hypothetical protein